MATAQMQNIYCHTEDRQLTVPADWDGTCPSCGGGFAEVVGPVQAQAPTGPRPGGFHTSFQLPGGRGTFHVISSGPMPAPPGFGGPGIQFVNPDQNAMRDMILNALMETGLALPDGALRFEGMGHETMDDIMTRIMNEYEPVSHPTSQRARRAFPRLKIREDAQVSPGMGEASAAPGEVCPVCHEAFKAREEVVELPCNHCFHEGCLMPWLETHNTCPVCRLDLPAEESRSDDTQHDAQHEQREAAPVYYASWGRPATASGNEEQSDVEQSLGSTLAQLVSNVAQQWLHANNVVDESQDGRRASASAAEPSRSDGSVHNNNSGSQQPEQSAPSEMRFRRGSAAAAAAAAAEQRAARQRSADQETQGPSVATSRGPSFAREACPDAASSPPSDSSGSEPSILGMIAGGIIAGLAGTALGAFLGSGRRSSQR